MPNSLGSPSFPGVLLLSIDFKAINISCNLIEPLHFSLLNSDKVGNLTFFKNSSHSAAVLFDSH